MDNLMPKCYKAESKPNLFCPGCGHSIILKQLGFVIDEMGIQRKTTLGIDIGCSLLAWNYFDVDTAQTHHGRTAPFTVGYKMAKPERIALAYSGDGGAYAIGLQSIIHAALRNNPITMIVVNNENYAMTGGQTSPETIPGTVTTTSPNGKAEIPGLKGPELIRQVANEKAFVTRVSISNPIAVKNAIRTAIENQINNNAFSFVEVLSICPTNWKADAKTCFARLKEMEAYYPLGEVK